MRNLSNNQRKLDGNKVISEELRAEIYDSARFILSNGVSDYDTRANESDMFSNLDMYSDFMIWADEEISVKFNSATSPSRLIEAGQVFASSTLDLTDLYVSNASGSNTYINFYGTQKGAQE